MMRMGRKKIEMKMILGANAQQVSFLKSRSSVFKKASELCTLCDAETAMIVFSPGGEAFSFGHPCVDTVLNRLLHQSPVPDAGMLQLLQAHHEAIVCKLNQQYKNVRDQLEAERKRGEKLKQMRMESQSHCWWEVPIHDLNLNELEKLKAEMEELKKNVANELLIRASTPAAF